MHFLAQATLDGHSAPLPTTGDPYQVAEVVCGTIVELLKTASAEADFIWMARHPESRIPDVMRDGMLESLPADWKRIAFQAAYARRAIMALPVRPYQSAPIKIGSAQPAASYSESIVSVAESFVWTWSQYSVWLDGLCDPSRFDAVREDKRWPEIEQMIDEAVIQVGPLLVTLATQMALELRQAAEKAAAARPDKPATRTGMSDETRQKVELGACPCNHRALDKRVKFSSNACRRGWVVGWGGVGQGGWR